MKHAVVQKAKEKLSEYKELARLSESGKYNITTLKKPQSSQMVRPYLPITNWSTVPLLNLSF